MALSGLTTFQVYDDPTAEKLRQGPKVTQRESLVYWGVKLGLSDYHSTQNSQYEAFEGHSAHESGLPLGPCTWVDPVHMHPRQHIRSLCRSPWQNRIAYCLTPKG